VIQHFSKSFPIPPQCVSLHGLYVEGKEFDDTWMFARVGQSFHGTLLTRFSFIIYFGCLPCQLNAIWDVIKIHTSHHDHLDCLCSTMGAHLSCLESIRCHGFQFGQEGFKCFLPSMVLVLPSSKNSLRIWPTMKFCPINLPPPWSNVPCPFVDKESHHCNKFVTTSEILHSNHFKNPSKFQNSLYCRELFNSTKNLFSRTYLYFSKPIPCLFIEVSLKYVIVCSMKKFMTIY